MRLIDDYEYVHCPHCHKQFKIRLEEQTPGFRMKDELYCPFCGEFITSSMEVEFYIEKD